MHRLLVLLIILGFFEYLSAQKPGYILTDTAFVTVEILPQNDRVSAETCQARFRNSAYFKTFTPDDILGYSCGNKVYEVYILKSGNDFSKKFLQKFINGDFPVYYLKDEQGQHFYILNDARQPIELTAKNGEYKEELSTYFHASGETIGQLHFALNRQGILQAADAMQPPGKRTRKPGLLLDIKSGITFQKLPLKNLNGLPVSWKQFTAISMTYSFGIDIPFPGERPFSFHQEVCYNKFTDEFKLGPDPPDYQLIQDYSVLSLPASIRYTWGLNRWSGFVNAGVQLDIPLNGNNLGWLIIDGIANSEEGNYATLEYISYEKFQPGITAGFGLNYKLNKQFTATGGFNYSGISNVTAGNSGFENQFNIKVGIAYRLKK